MIILFWKLSTSSDDLLTSQDEIISYFPHSYKIDAQDTDDGFDLGGMFEIYLAIYHNCNPQGNWKVVWHDCGSYPINVGKTQTEDIRCFGGCHGSQDLWCNVPPISFIASGYWLGAHGATPEICQLPKTTCTQETVLWFYIVMKQIRSMEMLESSEQVFEHPPHLNLLSWSIFRII
ncbi:hypothetical protein GCK72_000256 [Caenorhabditis remanei]|uniref:Uncharacterized protein n=1 Tax=Caenorhabditis remanei TaxID=31234 RepID=A0A6A5HPD1_CAERE|nr:hypothetical protein GCK72_000256 [Caenorhabditis remanei]KAF1768444.1 hypothetical protein GCK72_000256 [Caenorhabditis remanei]